VNHEFRWQIVSAGDSCVANPAPAQGAAFLEQFLASGHMNGAIHAASAEEFGIRGIDNRIDRQSCDVRMNDFNSCHNDVRDSPGWLGILQAIDKK
jgi:hypothetical protein